MAALREITKFLDDELQLTKFEDSSVNGLQVEGAPEVRLICASVDAGLSVIEEAARKEAQLLIVHHGLFWGGSIPIVGPHHKAVSCMLKSGLGLYAAHIPLDAHPLWGNNFGLARFLGLTGIVPAAEHRGMMIGAQGDNPERLKLRDFAARLEQQPGGGTSVLLPFGPAIPEKVCVVTGAGADQLYRHEADHFDTLITGEPRQFAFHFAKEHGLNVIFAGHYRTECIGVRLLGEELARRFGVKFEFINEPTGI